MTPLSKLRYSDDFKINLSKGSLIIRHIHIIGIGGIFMGGVTVIAKGVGFKVSGYNAEMYPPMSTQLETLGIDVHEGFDAVQLGKSKADIHVIGNVAKRSVDVIETILNKGLPYTLGPQWLAESILHQHWVLSMAGAHDKTITTSTLTWVLEYADLAPGFLTGGVPENFSVSAHLPQTPRQGPSSKLSFFVIKADEYDTAFFDRRSKFVYYRPRIAILDDLEFGRTDIFANLGAIRIQFHHLVCTMPSGGLIVCNEQQQSLQGTLDRGRWTPMEKSGTRQDRRAGAVHADGLFDVCYHDETAGHVAWELMDGHNRMNALAVATAACHTGVNIQTACEALSAFKNVKHRTEVKGTVNGIIVYDDFVHHPTAIETITEGLRQRVGNARILAVLEPRSNTIKLGTVKAALSASLRGADRVFCCAGGADWNAAEAFASLGSELHVSKDFNTFVAGIVKNAEAGDHILAVSNGGFGGIHGKLLEALK